MPLPCRPLGVPFYHGWKLYMARGLNKRGMLFAFGDLNLVDTTTRGLLKKASTIYQVSMLEHEASVWGAGCPLIALVWMLQRK